MRNIGDKVIIKKDLMTLPVHNHITPTTEMRKWEGKVMTISQVHFPLPTFYYYNMLEDGGQWGWSEDFIENFKEGMKQEEWYNFVYMLVTETWYAHHENKDFSSPVLYKEPKAQKQFLEYCDKFMEKIGEGKFSEVSGWTDRKNLLQILINKINN